MLLGWLDSKKATEVGISLADQFTDRSAPPRGKSARKGHKQNGNALRREFLTRAEKEVNALPLNFYKRAKLANAFRWRLIEKGVENAIAAEITQTLITHLSMIGRLTTRPGR